MSLLDSFLKRDFERNRTCEICQREVFHNEYFCEKCFEKLPQNGRYVCPVCGRKTFKGAGICSECKSDMPKFLYARSPFLYQDEIIPLIYRYKHGDKYLSVAFGREMLPLVTQFVRAECILYVPLTEEKRRKRGFNQAKLLADYISEHTSFPVYDILVRKCENEEQKGLSAKERKANVKGLFQLTDKSLINGKGVIVVDDVMTTGATLKEIANLLVKHGATYVYCLTIATTPLKGE